MVVSGEGRANLRQDTYIAKLKQEMVKFGEGFQMRTDHSKKVYAGK
jgi:hypothetical protein